jgi:hypothetical protein
MHFGNWDLGAAILSINAFPISAIADSFANERVNRLVIGSREHLGMKIIQADRLGPGILRALRGNDVVAMLIDVPQAEGGVQVEFFRDDAVSDASGLRCAPAPRWWRRPSAAHALERPRGRGPPAGRLRRAATRADAHDLTQAVFTSWSNWLARPVAVVHLPQPVARGPRRHDRMIQFAALGCWSTSQGAARAPRPLAAAAGTVRGTLAANSWSTDHARPPRPARRPPGSRRRRASRPRSTTPTCEGRRRHRNHRRGRHRFRIGARRRQRQTGVILISAHLGNPRWWCARAPFACLAATEPLAPPRVHSSSTASGRAGVQFIPATAAGLRAVLTHLHRGGTSPCWSTVTCSARRRDTCSSRRADAPGAVELARRTGRPSSPWVPRWGRVATA